MVEPVLFCFGAPDINVEGAVGGLVNSSVVARILRQELVAVNEVLAFTLVLVGLAHEGGFKLALFGLLFLWGGPAEFIVQPGERGEGVVHVCSDSVEAFEEAAAHVAFI